jgi:uncharacterized protein YfaS (alpha-2-macroglobulin family)
MPNTYYPGESIRFPVTIDVLGTPQNPVTLQLIVQDADGNQTSYGSPTNTAVGAYYQDITLTSNAVAGPWRYWWTCVGSAPNQDGVSAPRGFVVAIP